MEELFKDASGAERRIRKGVDVRRDATRFTQLMTHIEAVSLDLAHRSRKAWYLFGRDRAISVRSLEWSDGLVEHQASDYVHLLELLQARSGCQNLFPGEEPRYRDPVIWAALGRLQALKHLLQVLKGDLHPGWLALFPYADAKSAWSRIVVAWREAFGSFRKIATFVGDDEEFGLETLGKSVLSPGKPVIGQRRILERVNTLMIERLLPTLGQPAQVALARTVQETIGFYRNAERSNSAIVVVVSQGFEIR